MRLRSLANETGGGYNADPGRDVKATPLRGLEPLLPMSAHIVIRRLGIVGCAVGLLVLLWMLGHAGASPQEGRAGPNPGLAGVPPTSTSTEILYLPLVRWPSTFPKDSPIWTHSSVAAPHQVALFRHTFTLDGQLERAELGIFADTRYEVWVDGSWVGRGPARFSVATREYDVYPLGDLQPGSHLVAVLVQWAPNTRRSESVTPFLRAHVHGVTDDGGRVVTRTDSLWKALSSDAWRQDAIPVHSWRLIGPTELVDLRRIPHDWMLPAFCDSEWPAAVVKNLADDAAYRPRSIPLLDNVPITPTVRDAGLLSPGRAMGELVPPTTDPYSYAFDVQRSTAFTVEMLFTPESPPSTTVRLDGKGLVWRKGGAYRPDVCAARTPVAPGPHTLSFRNVPPQGLTFAISTRDIQSAPLPFEQGVHAGRRLLLAEPVSHPGPIEISRDGGMNVEFTAAPAYIVLDLGRVVHGRLVAEVTGPAGAIVDIGWDERLLAGTYRPLPYPGSLHSRWNQTDSWVLDGTTRSISTLDARAGRYVLIAVWGSGPVELGDIRVYEERFPVAQRGEFSCSNGSLDRIWQVGVDTLVPNMVDAYTDTPWRERGQWWGDAYVEDHVNRVSFGQSSLLRRGLLFMAEASTEGQLPALSPNGDGVHLLDYGMLWVQSLNDYRKLTADTQFVVSVYPVLSQFMRYLESYEHPTSGLLDVPLGHWSQTALIDWAAFYSRYGQSTAINALYYDTLMDAAEMAEELGDSAGAHSWRQKANLVKRQVNADLYLDAQSRYVTTIFEGEAVPPGPHAQAWALAYGLVPEREVGDVASSLLQLLSSDPRHPNVEIYGTFWVLDALGRAGRVSEALYVTESYYGRLLDLGATTWWEHFGSHLNYRASLSHGWGAAPTWFLTTYVLGARRLAPNTWLVSPAFQGVSHASGVLPLQDGELQVYWERPRCEDRRVELTSPVGAAGDIVLPFINATTVMTLNGQVVWRDGHPLADGVTGLRDGVHVSLEEGVYALVVHQDCSTVYLPAVTR